MAKFKVIKDFDEVIAAGKEFELANSFPIEMAQKLTQYFMEIKTGEFKYGYEYAEEVRLPNRGEIFVDDDGDASVAKANLTVKHYQILRKTKKKPSKDERLKALDDSIETAEKMIKVWKDCRKELMEK